MSTSFDWDKFESVGEPVTQNQAMSTSEVFQPIENKPSNEFNFDEFETVKEPESFKEETKRHALRSASRVFETLGGLPGDIKSLAEKGVGYVKEKISGKQEEDDPSKIKQLAKILLPFQDLPSSSDIKETVGEFTGGYTEPQSTKEQLADNIISDFASLAIPVKGKVPFLKTIGIAVGSNLAEKGAEMVGAGEKGQTATKLGTMFLLGTLNPKGASKLGNELYREAKALVPHGASIPANRIAMQSNRLKAQLRKGATAPYKAGALKKIDEIQSKIRNGRIAVEELTEFKVDINKAREALYLEPDLTKGGKALAKKNLDATAQVVDNALKEYGRINPAWEQKYRAANEVYGSIAQSKKASQSIGRFIKAHPHVSGAAVAAKLFLSPKAIPAAGVAYGALKTGELLVRINKSPTLRRYYGELLQAALAEDAASIAKYSSKLEAGLEKEKD